MRGEFLLKFVNCGAWRGPENRRSGYVCEILRAYHPATNLPVSHEARRIISKGTNTHTTRMTASVGTRALGSLSGKKRSRTR